MPSSASISHQSPLDLGTPREVQPAALGRHVLTAGDAENSHALVVPQVRKQFGCDEEVLRCMFSACDFHHALVDHALVPRIHTLIDLVDHAERGLRHRLEGHEIEDGRDGAFAAGLTMLVEFLEGLVFSEGGNQAKEPQVKGKGRSQVEGGGRGMQLT